MDHDISEICPSCGATLEERDGGFWCREDKEPFTQKEVAANGEWRLLSAMQKIERYKALGHDAARDKYFLRAEQLAQVKQLVSDDAAIVSTSKESVEPEKASIISLARGISDETALSELVDNAIDAGQEKRPGELITVTISFDRVLRSLIVVDDAGGMDKGDLVRCFTLGARKLVRSEASIGQYGIGAKEAIYHFGREVTVRSRSLSAAAGIRTIVTEDWLKDPDWSILVSDGLPDVVPGTTRIEIGRLQTTDYDEERVRDYLAQTYEALITTGSLKIVLDNVPINADAKFVKLFPFELHPRSYSLKSANVSVRIDVMLIRSPSSASGIFLYAQGRRFSHLNWAAMQVRMIIKNVQKSTLRDHIRLELHFNGPIEEIPINSNKNDLQSNALLQTVSRIANRVTEPYFKAIPPLSQLGLMSKVNLIVEGSEDAFPLESYDLGRVSDTSHVPSAVVADVEKFKQHFKVEPPVPPVAPVAPVPPPPAPPRRDPQDNENPNSGGDDPETIPQDPQQPRTAEPVAVGTIKFLNTSSDQLRARIRQWVDEGDALGVVVTCDWLL